MDPNPHQLRPDPRNSLVTDSENTSTTRLNRDLVLGHNRIFEMVSCCAGMRLASGAIQTGYTFGIERWGFVVFVMSTILLLLVVYTCIIAIRQKDSLD